MHVCMSNLKIEMALDREGTIALGVLLQDERLPTVIVE